VVRGLAMRRGGGRRYIWIARLMLLVGPVTIAQWKFTDFIGLFWVQASVFLLFMAFGRCRPSSLNRAK
jgi:hypothetical protein